MTEQLDFFDEPEVQDVWVKMLVTYEVPQLEGLPHRAFYEFADTAPYFEISNGILATFEDVERKFVELWHSEMPEPIEAQPTHFGGRMMN